MTRSSKSGFTLIEILIAMTLLSVMVAITVTAVNYSSNVSAATSGQLMAEFNDIESAFNQYMSEKNAAPSGLGDSTFAPTYLFVPQVPNGFDNTYGTTGFNLAQATGQASPNNGWYICTKVAVTGAADNNYIAIKKIASQLSTQKFFYNTSCPATTNMADPSGAATVYTSYWIMRL